METPENHPLTILKGFSTVSEVLSQGNPGKIGGNAVTWDGPNQ